MAQEYVDTQTGEVITGAELESRALAQVQPTAPVEAAATPLDLPAEAFAAALDRRKTNRTALMQWVRGALVENVDYGKIHVISKKECNRGRFCKDPNHFSKPSLWKPGAEKICGMLGVTAHFPTLGDYERAVLDGKRLQQVIIRCELRDAGGRVVADGVGARSMAQDNGDLNKALKMAEKAGMIDATLRMAGLSEVFTQDIEDMVLTRATIEAANPPEETPATGARTRNTTGAKGGKASKTSAGETASGGNGKPTGKTAEVARIGKITPSQLCTLRASIQRDRLDLNRVLAWTAKVWQVERLEDLNQKQFKRLLFEKLPRFVEQLKAETANDPIPDEEARVIRDYIEEKGLDLDGVERWIGCPVHEVTQGRLKEFWNYLSKLVADRARAEWDSLSEEEKLRIQNEGMAMQAGADEKAGRQFTRGT